MTYRSPTTISSYWNAIDENWNDIKHVLDVFLPTFGNRWIDGRRIDLSLGEYMGVLKEDRNPLLMRALSAALYNAPDDVGIWDYPVMAVMQDLLVNENYAHEDREED